MFCHNLTWKTHPRLPTGIARTKTVSHILFGAGFWINGVSDSFDYALLQFMNLMTRMPSCVTGTALKVEFAQYSFESRVWNANFNLSLKALFSVPTAQEGFCTFGRQKISEVVRRVCIQ